MAFRQLKTQGGNYVKWDTPKTVKGRLVGFQRGEYKGKPTMTVILVGQDGVQFKVSGSANIENSGLYNEQPGVTVELVYKGKGTTKAGVPFNDIDVFVDSPEPDPSTTRPTTAVPGSGAATGTTAPASNGGSPSEYDVLIAKLRLVNPKGADAIVTALESIAPDIAVRTEKLRNALKEMGIA